MFQVREWFSVHDKTKYHFGAETNNKYSSSEIFCDSSNCPARAGGLGAQGGSGQGALGQDEEGKGTVAVTVSSHIPGQIHRTFTGMRTGQGHLGG